MRTALPLLLALLLAACATTEETYQRQTAGHVGCPPDRIVIRDAANSTWTAICRGRWYYCSKAVPSTTDVMFGGATARDAALAPVHCSPSSGGESDDE